MDQDGFLTSSRYFEPNIDTLLTKVYRSWWTFFYWVVTICIGSFYIGYTSKLTIFFEPVQDFKYWKFVVNMSSYPISAFFGALSCYFFIKKVSQRRTLCIAGIIGMIGTIILYIGESIQLDQSQSNLVLKLFGKGIQGFAGGIFSVYCPCVIKDIVPIQQSVTFGSFHQLSIVFGLFTSKIFELIILKHSPKMQNKISQIPVLFPIPFLILMIILIQFYYKTQTAKYLIQNKKIQQAKNLIDKLYRQSVSEQIYLEIEYSVNATDNQQFQGQFDMRIVKRRIIIVGIGVAIIQQISGSSIVNTYGLYPYNSQYKNEEEANFIFHIIQCSIQIAMIFILILLNSLRNNYNNKQIKIIKIISKRRNLFRIGIFITIIVQISIVIISSLHTTKQQYFSSLKIILYIFAANYGLTLGPMTWIYLSQISDIFQMTSALLASWLVCFITIAILPQIPGISDNNLYNLSSGLLTLACINVIFWVLTHLYLVETKYKSDIEIYRELSALKFDSWPCKKSQDEQDRLSNR